MRNETIKIKKPLLFSFAECLWFLDRNFDDCLHEIADGRLRKAININNELILFEAYEAKQHIEIIILNGKLKNPQYLIDYIEDWLDMKRDIRPFYNLLKQDVDLCFLATHFSGLRIIGIPELFEALCWSIIGQQINLTFAYKLKRQLVERYGKQTIFKNKVYYLFPNADVIANLSVDELRTLQFSTRKAEYIIGIAKLVNDGALNKKKLLALGDDVAMLTHLKSIRGIGEWTAQYVLMKSLRHMDSIAYGDSGLNNALFKIKGFDKKNNRKEINNLFAKFNGWKSYLNFYLWRSLSENVNLKA